MLRKELKLVQNLQNVFFALPNLPLSSPDTDSEDQLEYHRNTILNNFNRFIEITNRLLTKTGFIQIKNWIYTRLEYINFTINRINKL